MSIAYRILRGPLFRLDAEQAHELTTGALRRVLASPALRARVAARLRVDDPALVSRHWGIDFPNPVGLAAGFDKAGTLFNALGALGFGFIEIGTVTAEAQPGNARPRLFRLPEDRALLNRMGFNNPGADAVATSLATTRREPVVGINIGKSKVAPLDRATDDYLRSVDRLAPFADYLVINVSSPNTPGLRALQSRDALAALIGAVLEARVQLACRPPLLLKIAPDLTDADRQDIAEVALASGLDGLIVSNTTLARPPGLDPRFAQEAGGLSGRPLFAPSTEILRDIYRRTGGKLPIVGVGGIASAADVYAKIRAGASLVQVYSALVFEGPGLVRRIKAGLAALLARDGFANIGDAVGADHR